MAKKPSTIVLPAKSAKSVAPVVLPLPAAIAAALSKSAPNAADIEAAAEAERKAAIVKTFGDTFADYPTIVTAVDALGAELVQQYDIGLTHAKRAADLIAALYVSPDYVTWPVHSLIGKYIGAKFGDWARTRYSAALKIHCEAQKWTYPTAGHGAGNGNKGISPVRKQAKLARAVDNVVTAMAEFHATIVVDAPSVAIWTRILKDLRDVQALAKQEADNAKLKRTA